MEKSSFTETAEASIDPIVDAILKGFRVSKLQEALSEGAVVSNDYSEGMSTFSSFMRHVKNLKLRNEDLNEDNLVRFFRVLLRNEMEIPENGLEIAKESNAPSDLKNLIRDRVIPTSSPSLISQDNHKKLQSSVLDKNISHG